MSSSGLVPPGDNLAGIRDADVAIRPAVSRMAGKRLRFSAGPAILPNRVLGRE